MKPTLVEPQSRSGYGKVPFATSGPPNLTNTGDIHKNNYKSIILEMPNSAKVYKGGKQEDDTHDNNNLQLVRFNPFMVA